LLGALCSAQLQARAFAVEVAMAAAESPSGRSQVRGLAAQYDDQAAEPWTATGRTPRFDKSGGESSYRVVRAHGYFSGGWRVALIVGSCLLAFAIGTLCRPLPNRSSMLPSSALYSDTGSGEFVDEVELGALASGPEERRAYVMMAWDTPGSPISDCLWGALAMARALQRFSKYPLVLLTNTTVLPDGLDLKQTLDKLNVRLLPVHKISIPGKPGWSFDRWEVAFWKLQVWTLTEYDKLIWMDSDAIAYRNLDWIFDKPGMWSQRDDWFCKGSAPGICSGIMSLEPSIDTYNGLIQYAGRVIATLNRGDQQLISQYFAQVVQKPVQLLDDADAAFGQCLGGATGLGFEHVPTGSWWDTRAFIHKSGGFGNTNDNDYNNVCFSSNMTRQRYVIGGNIINACHFHPLAAYWRGLFCEAASIVGARMSEVMTFCSDSCYYTGLALDGTPCENSQAWELTTPLSSTLQRYPPGLLFHLAPLGKPALDQAGETFPSQMNHGFVNYQLLEMQSWNCRGECSGGGCCKQEDCEWQCSHNAQMQGGFCKEARWLPASMSCQMFGSVKAVYSSRGGHSGVVFSESLAYPGAALPKAPFTIMAKIRSESKAECQDIISWGDGLGSWKSVEFRLTLGNLLYGEEANDEWTQVASEDSKLADGEWHDVAVVRPANGEVILYIDGKQASRGFMGKEPMGLMPMARSARMSHSPGCILNGDVGHLDIYDFEVSPGLLNQLVGKIQ